MVGNIVSRYETIPPQKKWFCNICGKAKRKYGFSSFCNSVRISGQLTLPLIING
jgi:hypothetical protein